MILPVNGNENPAEARPVVMHVLHTLKRGGAETLVHRLVDTLNDRYRFVIASLDELGPLEQELRDLGAEVHLVGRRPGFDTGCGKRLASIVSAAGADVIHAHQYTPFVYSALAKKRLGGASKLIFTEHGRHNPDRPRLRRVAVNRLWLTRQADRLTAVADAVRHALVDNEHMPSQRIELIRNGVSIEKFRPIEHESQHTQTMALRRSLGVEDHQSLVLQVARLRPVKNHEAAIDALGRLRGMRCDAVLVLAGDGPLQSQMEKHAQDAGLSGSVRFLGSRDDVADLWRAADVGLLTSKSEGLSVAAMEAHASGTPMVATDVGGNGEIIDHGTTGLLTTPDNENAIAHALFGVLMNDGLRMRMASDARRRAELVFDESIMHAGYDRLYSELIYRDGASPDAHHATHGDTEAQFAA